MRRSLVFAAMLLTLSVLPCVAGTPSTTAGLQFSVVLPPTLPDVDAFTPIKELRKTWVLQGLSSYVMGGNYLKDLVLTEGVCTTADDHCQIDIKAVVLVNDPEHDTEHAVRYVIRRTDGSVRLEGVAYRTIVNDDLVSHYYHRAGNSWQELQVDTPEFELEVNFITTTMQLPVQD